MTMTVQQTAHAVAANIPASFAGTGGMEPYAYTVVPGGAGGTINIATGVYRAPAVAPSDPDLMIDTILVTDYANVTATAQITVGRPIDLLCEILQRELGLSARNIFLWNQKILQPTDSGLYVAVSIPRVKPFGSSNRQVSTSGGMVAEQYGVFCATVDVDIISRGPEARDRKELVVLALSSVYSQNQQTANGFKVGKLPPHGQFVDLSSQDGTAIPYRYRISFLMQYAVGVTKPVDYFDEFEYEANENA